MLTGRATAALVLTCALTAGTGATPVLAASSAPPGSALPSGAARQLLLDFAHAWRISLGRGVTVAVLSTGVDPSTPGLKGRVTVGPDYTGLPHPARLVGSVVAGMIAGDGDLDSRTVAAGLAPQARILSIRIEPDGGESGAGRFDDESNTELIDGEGIRYAASHGAQVIFIDQSFMDNLAFADLSHLEPAIRYAIARGTVIVSEAEDFTARAAEYDYPESVPGVIGVGAVQLSDAGPPFDHTRSSQNQSILVAGPSNEADEPLADGVTQSIDGPEGAAATVAAVAALVKSAYPHLSAALVAQSIALSARYRPAGGYNTTLGFGLVNPDGALQEAARLSRATHTQASVGQVATTRFRPGPPLPPIEAAQPSPAALAGPGAAIVAGVLCLAAALVLLLRRRRSRPGPAGPGAEPIGSEQLAEPQ